MRGLTRKGQTWYLRFLIPKDRQGHVGRAYGVTSGTREEFLRTLKTTDRREALQARDRATRLLVEEIDAKLAAIGCAPLHGEWSLPKWADPQMILEEALSARVEIASASGRDDEAEMLDTMRRGKGAQLPHSTSPRDRVIEGLDEMLDHRVAKLDALGQDGEAYARRFLRVAFKTPVYSGLE